MRSVWTLVVVILILTPVLPSQDSGGQEPLPIWFDNCAVAPGKLGITILINEKTIYRSSFPVCESKERPKERKVVAFTFRGGHTFQGEYRTKPTQIVEGNIWQAGTDPDAIWLGISFATNNQSLLNTLHYAKPNRESSTLIDKDVVVRTFPLKRD
jgi:hypothetical protein